MSAQYYLAGQLCIIIVVSGIRKRMCFGLCLYFPIKTVVRVVEIRNSIFYRLYVIFFTALFSRGLIYWMPRPKKGGAAISFGHQLNIAKDASVSSSGLLYNYCLYLFVGSPYCG